MSNTACLFPGQGSQYIGMSGTWLSKYAYIRELFEEAGDVLGFDVQRLCLEGPQPELDRTHITQPAVFAASAAAYRIFEEETGIRPAVAAGHSLGEFTALMCAGVFSFADGLRLVQARGRLMEHDTRRTAGTMFAVVGLDAEAVSEACRYINDSLDAETGECVVVANSNGGGQFVISGHRRAVDEAGAHLAGLGARVVPLKVGGAFHSPLMREAAERLREELSAVTFAAPRLPVVLNGSGELLEDVSGLADYLSGQLVGPVNWEACMRQIAQMRIGRVVELGPGTVLTRLWTQQFAGLATAYALDDGEDERRLMREAANGFFNRCLAIAVSTPNKAGLNADEYAGRVVKPYRALEALAQHAESGERMPGRDERALAERLLLELLEAKRTDRSELETCMAALYA